MDNLARSICPGLGELLDRLAISQIKEVLDEKNRLSFSAEIGIIGRDIDRLMENKRIKTDAYFIRLIIALGQINLYIWKTKDVMQSDVKQFNRSMKLAHQLNGIRNQIKNLITAEYSSTASVTKRTNTGIDGLKGWDINILRGGRPVYKRCLGRERRLYRYLLTDLIDMLAVNQLKEVFLPEPKRDLIRKEVLKVSEDIDQILTQKKLKLTSVQLRLIILLSQANLFIWLNKEQLRNKPGKYYDLLAFAQDLNGLRNFSRNLLMAELKEDGPCRGRVTFLKDDKSKWYSSILESMRLPKTGDIHEKSLTVQDFSRLFATSEDDLPQGCREIIMKRDFRYRDLDKANRDRIIADIIKRIDSQEMWVSGPDKKDVWENGWSENLNEFKKNGDISALTPKFIQPHPVLRLDRDYIRPFSPRFEFDFADVLRRWAFGKYLKNAREIYEFGCGSCQHIPVLAELFPGKPLHGLDWAQASSKIIEKLAREKKWDITGHIFDLFKPDDSLLMKKNAAVFTMGAMEQLGQNFGPFLDFLLRKKPKVVMHLETLRELYDESYLTDYLAIRYDDRRNYLDGYLGRLRRLEQEGALKIIKAHRVFFGSMYHDSYSMLIWSPS